MPAATDLIVAMGEGDRLVGVSTYDTDPAVAGLPRVGDYLTVDWERLAELKPAVMVVQFAPDRAPPGLLDRAAAMGATVVNVRIDRLDDVYATLATLGDAMGTATPARATADRIRARLRAVEAQVAGRPPVRTFLAFDADLTQSAGPGTFLDDVLTIAGGANALPADAPAYPTVDRERLVALAPEAVVALLPGATPRVVGRAKGALRQTPDLPAVRAGRTQVLTDDWVLLPGSHVADLAEALADALHGRP